MVFLQALFCLFFLIFLYQSFVFLLGIIPANPNFTSAEKGIEIYVGTNGVHTDLVFPIVNEHIDWRELIPLKDFPQVDTTYRYIAMGWGDKGFYIQTPTWQDLTFNIAFKALFLATPAAMHITYLRNAPKYKDNYVEIRIRDQEYIKLINFITPYFQSNEKGELLLIPEARYRINDNFYEAHGNYHLLNTSNNWTNSALKSAGIRAALWAPLDQVILHQLRKSKEE
ncbi:TIGR02117 family protein [soil metagenome]